MKIGDKIVYLKDNTLHSIVNISTYPSGVKIIFTKNINGGRVGTYNIDDFFDKFITLKEYRKIKLEKLNLYKG